MQLSHAVILLLCCLYIYVGFTIQNKVPSLFFRGSDDFEFRSDGVGGLIVAAVETAAAESDGLI